MPSLTCPLSCAPRPLRLSCAPRPLRAIWGPEVEPEAEARAT